MSSFRLISLVIFLVMAVSLISIWFYPTVSDFMAANRAWNGIRNFTQEFNVKHVESLENISGRTEANVLVCIPYIDYTPEELSEIEGFVNNGNLLLIMDNFGYGNTILEHLGIEARFSNKYLLDPLFNYRNQYLPRITKFSANIEESGVEAITFNHATSLNNVEHDHILATSSSSSFLDINNNGVHDEGEPAGPLVAAARYDLTPGMVVLISDPSITINTMVGENDNYKFIEYIISLNGEPDDIILDRSHITRTPLDASKIGVEHFREIIASEHVLLGVVALIFILIPAYMFKKGELFR